MKSLLLFFSCWLFIIPALFSQPNIIFDTDIGSDCDDAGAMAVLHKLADKGEVNILGIICSSGKIKEAVGVCDAINTYYKRPDLPIGQYTKDDVGDPKSTYLPQIGRDTATFKHDLTDTAPDFMEIYKKLLYSQPDSSVTIVTVGHPHGLHYLMASEEGMELISRKVVRWVAMTHTLETPKTDWNFGRNGAAPYVGGILKKWPKEAIFSGLGQDILTGNKKLPATSDNNPVKKAYTLWNNAILKGRSSWDQVAVLVAVRPDLFNYDTHGSLVQTDDGKTYWDKATDNPKHRRVVLKTDKKELEAIIEELMSEPPK